MMRKWFTLLLTMTLLAAVLPVSSLAESWICPRCGAENTMNFCGTCGTARPTPVPDPIG